MIRPVVWTLVGLSAASPAPSLCQAPRLVQRRPALAGKVHCAGECPSNSDRLDSLAKLLHAFRLSSTSTTQWLIGSSGPYTSARL